jgi:hypothetical protein
MNHNGDNRHNDEQHYEEFELTPSEKKALDELPRDCEPSQALEDRLVNVLRERGLLKPARHRVIELTAGRMATVAAACLVLLVTGFVLGQWAESRRMGGDDLIIHGKDHFSEAAYLQQAGSAYVQALQRLNELPNTLNGDQALQGREVALITLCTAADKITRLVPKDLLAGRLLTTLERDSRTRVVGGPGEVTIEANKVIEF